MILNQYELEKKINGFIEQIERDRPDLKLDHEALQSSLMGMLFAEYQGNNAHVESYFSQILLQLGLLDYKANAVFSELAREMNQGDDLGQGPDVDAFLRRVNDALPHYDPERKSAHEKPNDPKPR